MMSVQDSAKCKCGMFVCLKFSRPPCKRTERDYFVAEVVRTQRDACAYKSCLIPTLLVGAFDCKAAKCEKLLENVRYLD